jgi:antitoxin (DNA-binding transcriptional repressor) of toxin-antitoxin stability system
MQPMCHNSADRTMPRSAKMPSITLSQLRETKRLLAWLRSGKTVELRERNRVIAHFVPVEQKGEGAGNETSQARSRPNRKEWLHTH